MMITNVFGREILDSRGKPTVECHIILSDGTTVTACTPAGASLGSGEAKELRDNDKNRYYGCGVLQAVNNINVTIAPLIVGKKPDLIAMDKEMIALDGTSDKARLGANALVATSMAVARAQAHAEGLPLYRFIGISAYPVMSGEECQFPRLMVNVINGGAHANNNLSIQEFLVIPPRQETIAQEIEMAATSQHYLKERLEQDGKPTTVGDEGGFAPEFSELPGIIDEQVLAYLTRVLETHHERGFSFGLDVAASHCYDHTKKMYALSGQSLTAQDLILFYQHIMKNYPLISIEDGLDEHDFDGWKRLTDMLGKKIMLVGDDIFVTNPTKIQQGIDAGIANAVIIKPNQIGTVSEAIHAVHVARNAGYKIVASHRSGETNDSFIADFAVGIGADYLKAGGCIRGERVAKYNRLMEIEREQK